MKLSRRTYRALVTAHVLCSVGWFGMAVVSAFSAVLASVRGEPALALSLYRTIEALPWLSIPTGLAAAITGILLGFSTKFGLIRYWWVVTKMGIAAAVVVTDAVLVARVAHMALLTGHAPVPLYGSTIAHVVVLAIATVLSFFKPWGRTPWARSEKAAKLSDTRAANAAGEETFGAVNE
ncbi:MAG TPA: hypothetical protein VK540_06685 [Polyangiaceae bacterium]|nr:hypothetical protein [Polyangiaceae bacterium]